ncbi:small nuclear ribonucleoprotein-associated protein b, partial [Moniliophthora roreri MCA 2997]
IINWRLKVTINDSQSLVGPMLAFDRHMRVVLTNCEESRRVRPKKKPGDESTPPEREVKWTLGLVVLRGDGCVEGPPPVEGIIPFREQMGPADDHVV